jgi:hypothetical protein
MLVEYGFIRSSTVLVNLQFYQDHRTDQWRHHHEDGKKPWRYQTRRQGGAAN